MSRKKKSSPAEDLVEIVAFMPWWLGVALALIFYFYLHSMATAEAAATAGNTEQLGQLAVDALKKTLAGFGQYLVPSLCLLGAVISFLRRRARIRLIDDVIKGDGSTALREMSWEEFERVVGEGFRLRGFSVVENGGAGADGGIDLILKKDGEKFFVQCKQWRAVKVGVTVVRELYGVMAAGSVTGGFVVTCGQFTSEAKAFANGRNVTLLDGGELEKMIRQARGASTSSRAVPDTQKTAGQVGPQCPTCGSAMIERTAKRGAGTGNKFWGCASYPACKRTIGAS
jgi:restriction system protein